VTSRQAARAHEGTTFEASCYTDPLGLEHLTGSLAAAVEHFGRRPGAALRFTTKFDAVGPLLALEHCGRTRARFSVNAVPGFEGGTAPVPRRLAALRAMAAAGYPVGLTIAPIMPVARWRERYAALLDDCAAALAGLPDADLTAELITHRFTPTSKEVLRGWYPGSRLEMDEQRRASKRGRHGNRKYVYRREEMVELRRWFEAELEARLPAARLLYFT
jgi:spore photoproduct lyase